MKDIGDYPLSTNYMTYLPRNNARVGLLLSVSLPLLALFLSSCTLLGEPSSQASDFEVTLFDGSKFRLSDETGQRAVVLNFWFPSCPPCRAEMPGFQVAWEQVQDEDVRFLGLFVPQGFDSEQDARDFVQELGLTYDFATDFRLEITRAYSVMYYPTTIFVDKSGRIFRTDISTLDSEKIARIVQEMSPG